MLRRDYIMKMIEEFVRVISRVVLLRETKSYTDAKLELDSLSVLITGFGLGHLRSLGANGIAYVLGLNKETETEKIYCTARIFKEDAMILEAEGKTEESLNSFKFSKELFELVSDRDFEEKEEPLKEIEFLENKITRTIQG